MSRKNCNLHNAFISNEKIKYDYTKDKIKFWDTKKISSKIFENFNCNILIHRVEPL